MLPGNYNSGMTFNKGGTYTMSPGVYYVTGDISFKKTGVNVCSPIAPCTGVTIVLLSGKLDASSNNSSLNITAPTSGALAGVAIWEPAAGTGTIILGNQNFTANVVGLIYAPNALVSYGGNSGTLASPNCLQVVANSMTFTGNSMYIKGDCSSVPGLKKFGQLVALVD
jgi:hypothetical protein